MMLIAALLILFSVAGTYGQAPECFREKVQICNKYLEHIEHSNTTQELLFACQDFQLYGSCAGRAKRKCGEIDQADEIRQAVLNLNSICRKDNPAFKGTYDLSAECFREKVQICNKYLGHIEYPITSEELQFSCQNFQLYGSCAGRAKRKCGEIVQADEIRQAALNLNTICREGNPAFKASYSEAAECFREKVEICNSYLELLEYPNTTQELLFACQDFQLYGSCTGRAKRKCGEIAQANEIREAVLNLNSICKKDNPAFKVIANNLECVKSVFQTLHTPCWRSFSEENRRKIEAELKKYRDSSTEVNVCLMQLMEINCKGKTFGHHCGTEVKDAVEHFLTAAGNTQAKCPPDIHEELEPFSQFYLQILVEEIDQQNALERNSDVLEALLRRKRR